MLLPTHFKTHKIHAFLGLFVLWIAWLSLAVAYYVCRDTPEKTIQSKTWTAIASHNSSDAHLAFDEKPQTLWQSGTSMQSGMFFQLDLQRKMRISRIELLLESSVNDYPRDYQLAISSNGKDWELISTRGNLMPPVLTIHLLQVTSGRYIKVIQTADMPDMPHWSIHEINIYRESLFQQVRLNIGVIIISVGLLFGFTLSILLDRTPETKRRFRQCVLWVGLLVLAVWLYKMGMEERFTRIVDTNFWQTSSHMNENKTYLAIDGWHETLWETGTAMEPGMDFVLDLGKDEYIGKIFLNSRTVYTAARGYRIETSLDGHTWKPLLCSNALEIVIRTSFFPVKARYIRIVQTGQTFSGQQWAIHEIQVYRANGKMFPLVLVSFLLLIFIIWRIHVSLNISFSAMFDGKKGIPVLCILLCGGGAIGIFLWRRHLPATAHNNDTLLTLFSQDSSLFSFCVYFLFYSFFTIICWWIFSSMLTFATGASLKDLVLRILRFETLCLAGILILSFTLNVSNNGFYHHYHGDEVKKLRFIRENYQDFHHPILMLQSARMTNAFFGFKEDEKLAPLARSTTAFFGTLTVLLMYMIFRKIVSRKGALVIACATAVSPILVVHSHYIKEDILQTAFCMLSLYCLMNVIQAPGKRTTIMLGLATGFAFSSHYKSVLLVGLYLITPFLVPTIKKRRYYLAILVTLFVSLLVFCVVNYPVFFDFQKFLQSSQIELNHSLAGHHVKIPGISYLFGFHLFHSILPGLTPIVTAWALVCILYHMFYWKKTSWRIKILMVYTFIFYLVVEVSPLKPWPDFMRYIIPTVPPIIGFSCLGFIRMHSIFSSRKMRQLILGAGVFFLVGLPFWQSAKLVYHINKDTRQKVQEWFQASGEQAFYAAYAKKSTGKGILQIDIDELQSQKVSYLVVSSFMFDRYRFGSTRQGQLPKVYASHEKYQTLFQTYPFVEIEPAYKSFAFSNPTLRILDLRR